MEAGESQVTNSEAVSGDGVPRSPERMAEVNGVRLCLQTFGRPSDPAILLLGGASSSMDWWEEEFCTRLAKGPRFVIRFDYRDTGRSVSYGAGAPPYTGPDLMADALGLLDTLEVAHAHLVGVSMGGAIAQALALDHPERVATLTLIATSAVGPLDAELPPMEDRLRAVLDAPAPQPDWSDREAVITYLVEGQRPFTGSLSFEEDRLRAIAARVVERSTDIAASMTNHWLLDGGETSRYAVGEITAPTLILHGTEDPLFRFPHAEALAAAIPGARLIPLEGVGHQTPPHAAWPVAIPAILRHTAHGAQA